MVGVISHLCHARIVHPKDVLTSIQLYYKTKCIRGPRTDKHVSMAKLGNQDGSLCPLQCVGELLTPGTLALPI